MRDKRITTAAPRGGVSQLLMRPSRVGSVVKGELDGATMESPGRSTKVNEHEVGRRSDMDDQFNVWV